MKVQPVEGGVELQLDDAFVGFLLQFPQMLDSIERGSDDPVARRMEPAVYPDDDAANDEWWGFMSDELDRSRRADRSEFRAVMAASVEGVVVDDESARAVLRVLVESRLALAARIGIETESDYARLGPTEGAMLDSLGQLQVALLAALSGDG
jgi:hypothetical protein